MLPRFSGRSTRRAQCHVITDLFFPFFSFLSFFFLFFLRLRSIIRMDRERRISRPYVEITRHATTTANFRHIATNQTANTFLNGKFMKNYTPANSWIFITGG